MSDFTDLVGCERPLQLAGMGVVGTSGLTAAVTNAGALGMIGAGGMSAERLRTTLDEVESSTSGPFGVNFLIPFLDPEAVPVAARRARVVEFFFGEPDDELVATVHEHRALAAWQVGSAEEASAAARAGCDFIVAQGIEAGGHVRGSAPLVDLLRSVARDARVPVVAAGGIGTAKDVVEALSGGASAVRVGTRFVAAEECGAHEQYVDALIDAEADETVLTDMFGIDWNAPHRVLRRCVDAVGAISDSPIAHIRAGGREWPVSARSSIPPTSTTTGRIEAMPMYAGTSVGAVRARQKAADIVDELCADL